MPASVSVPPAGGRLRGFGALSALVALTMAGSPLRAQTPVPETAEEVRTNAPASETWLDHVQKGLHRFVWRSARSIDSLAGRPADELVYQEASGGVALAVLWDEFTGVRPRVRFHVDLPLPQINERLRLFVGRVNREEFVTEREEPSGAFPRLRDFASEEDQTLAGLIYSTRPDRHGGSFSAGAGLRVRSSELDPYVKASFRYRRVLGDEMLFTGRETLFYQVSEGFGLTTRVDVERLWGRFWRLRWTGSATISEALNGVRGYTTLTATRGLPGRQALIARVGIDADTNAVVPVRDFGIKLAYRRSILRDWLVLELRSSVGWPKEVAGAPRKPSWGVGIGCEMFFGTPEFSSKPVTF